MDEDNYDSKNEALADAELVDRIIKGRASDFEILVERYSTRLVRFAHHMLGDFQTAEDVTQDAFLKAFNHLGRLENHERFATWLYSIARHLCLDAIRARRNAVSVDVLAESGIDIKDENAPPPSSDMELSEMHSQVLDALGELRPDYRELILMKHVYEFSYKEIADASGKSVSAIGEKLSRVRHILREKLTRESNDLPKGGVS